MKNNYSKIESLFAELDYYENKGFYKLADDISLKIKKIAKQFDANTDLGYKGMNDFFNNLKIQYACKIPECQEFYCGSGSGQFTVTPDVGDFLTKEYSKNPNANYVDLMNKFNKSNSSQALKSLNLTPDKAKKLGECHKKMALQSSSTEAVGATSQQNTSTAQQAAPAREPMPPL